MRNFIFFVLAACMTIPASAQMVCGTDQTPLIEQIMEYKKNPIPVERGVVKYVPITFHLVANTAGNGRVVEENILSQVAALNTQYQDHEFVYYIKELKYPNSDHIYNTPASTVAVLQMRSMKSNNSMNIFVTKEAESGSQGAGTTLAYYSPNEDWVVSRQDRINGALSNSTLAHEIGHFFSLAHPHLGWECKPYTEADYGNPVSITVLAPCNGQAHQVELHNRSNCNLSGDRLCDTPEDYNIGFYANNCEPNTTVMDPNGELINPMVNNFMGYYNSCSEYAFTPGQASIMNSNFFSPTRNYLRTGVVPNTDPVEGPVNYIAPINGEETSSPSNILLDWEDVPGANQYLLIYARNTNFSIQAKRVIVNQSEFLIQDELLPNVTYYWKVWPFNESQTGAGYSSTQNFVVGTGVNVNEIHEVSAVQIVPNPVSKGQAAVMEVVSAKHFDATLQVLDYTGRVLSSEDISVREGESSYLLPVANLPGGIYVVLINSRYGRLIERIVITD